MGEGGGARRYVSSGEVARLAGVSQSAVSRTYTKGASVSPATRDKVLQAARVLGYRPNLLPQALMTSRSRLVAVVVGGLANPFHAGVLEQLTAALQAAGQQVVLIQLDSDYALDAVLDRVAGYRVDALVSDLAVLSEAAAQALSGLGIPVVCFNGLLRAPWVSSVSMDNRRAGAQAAAHLLDAGGTRLAFVGGPADSPAAEERRRGFAGELRRRRLPAPLLLPGDYSYEGGRALGGQLLASQGCAALPPGAGSPTPRGRPGGRPDAVACANDLTALGVLDALRVAGLGWPGSMRVLGFDNVGMSDWAAYGLTSFDQDVPALVRHSLRLLLDEDASAEARAGVLRTLPARLVVRRSTMGDAPAAPRPGDAATGEPRPGNPGPSRAAARRPAARGPGMGKLAPGRPDS